MIANWGTARGMYRGSRHMVLEATPEEWAITELVCDSRDLWKQNEVYAVFLEVRQMLNAIDVCEKAA
jgi:hypothetical protein